MQAESIDPVRAFAEIFDRLTSPAAHRGHQWWPASAKLAGERGIRSRVREEVRQSGMLSSKTLKAHSSAVGKLGVLLGVDDILGEALTQPEASVPAPIRYLRSRYTQSGRLDDGDAMVLPRRRGYAGTRSEEGVYSVVRNTLRVPAAVEAQIDLQNALRWDDRVVPYANGLAEPGISVACLPFIDHVDELEFGLVSYGGVEHYTIAPRDGLRNRVRAALAALDESGCVLGLVPELALSKSLLDEWKAAVTPGRPSASRLRWVLIGSGDVSSRKKAGPHRNTAVLLDRLSGLVVLRQDKRYPFNIQESDIKSYGLDNLFMGGPLQEFIQTGSKMSVLEADFGRLGIFVCEDLSRPEVNMPVARAVGLTHLLVPVFSKELVAGDRWGWELQRADEFGGTDGVSTVVATSLAIPRARQKSSAGSLLSNPAVTSLAVAYSGARSPNRSIVENRGDPLEVAIHPSPYRSALA